MCMDEYVCVDVCAVFRGSGNEKRVGLTTAMNIKILAAISWLFRDRILLWWYTPARD